MARTSMPLAARKRASWALRASWSGVAQEMRRAFRARSAATMDAAVVTAGVPPERCVISAQRESGGVTIEPAVQP